MPIVLFLAITIPGIISSLIAEVNNGTDLIDSGIFGLLLFIVIFASIAGLGIYALIISQYFYIDEDKLVISRSKGLINRNHKRITLYWKTIAKISQDTIGDNLRFTVYDKNDSVESLIITKW